MNDFNLGAGALICRHSKPYVGDRRFRVGRDQGVTDLVPAHTLSDVHEASAHAHRLDRIEAERRNHKPHPSLAPNLHGLASGRRYVPWSGGD
jgi:hypothetical protein